MFDFKRWSRKQWALSRQSRFTPTTTDTSLGLTVLAEESATGTCRISVAYFNRSQTDGLRGWFASIQRSIVEGRVRASLLKNLAGMRDRLGKAFRMTRDKRTASVNCAVMGRFRHSPFAMQ